jgi:hypothetical protein
MANKTLQFFGNGYAPADTDAEITATLGGNTVFSGSIPTVHNSGDILYLPADQQLLFTCEVDETLDTTVPMTVTVTAGDAVALEQVLSNLNNQAGNVDTFLTMGDSSQRRLNVIINGVSEDPPTPRPTEAAGEWLWVIPAAGTLACDLLIQPVLIGNTTPG